MSSIDKRKGQKYYRYRYMQNGKQKSITLRVSTLNAARRLQVKLDAQIAEGNFGLVAPDPITFKALCGEYIKFIESQPHKYTSRTIENYKASIKVFKKQYGHMALSEFTRGFAKTQIMPWLESCYNSRYTVRGHAINFRTIMSYAIDAGHITENPFRKLIPSIKTKIPTYFSEEEIKLYKEYWSSPQRPPWQQTYFLLLLHTGMRRTECFSLTWSEHVDLDNNLIMPLGKGEKERLIPLSDQAAAVLRFCERRVGEDRVFWQINSTDAIDEAQRVFKKRTGWPHRLHDTRSNWASYYAMRVGNLFKLRQILGHKDQSSTDKYAVFIPKYLEEERNVNTF